LITTLSSRTPQIKEVLFTKYSVQRVQNFTADILSQPYPFLSSLFSVVVLEVSARLCIS
jgi:hypothetical protein